MEKRPNARVVCIRMINDLSIVTIETHFGIDSQNIKTITRNNCSDNLVEIIKEVARTVYPNKEFEIYFAPSETGSYRDLIKIYEKNKIGIVVGSVITIGTLVIQLLGYKDEHKSHGLEDNKTSIETIQKCLELQKSVNDLGSEYEITGISEEKLSQLCNSVGLIRRKNSIYDTLARDETVKSNEFILKNSENTEINSFKVEKNDFSDYIEQIPDNHYSGQDFGGTIELISPVFKQKKEGKGRTWRGTYYGESVMYNDVVIIANEEEIEFYMQDEDFKQRISDQEQSFKIGDTLKIVFDVSGEVNDGEFSNRSVYVKEVQSLNEMVIPHTQKVLKKVNIISENQGKLFEQL